MRPPAQGEVWWSSQPEPAGRRPVLVLTRSSAARRLNSITVAQMTTTIRGIASEVAFGPDDGLPRECAASLDNIATLPHPMLTARIATVGAHRMIEVFRAIRYVFDIPEPGTPEREGRTT